MSHFRTILHPTDFSPLSQTAFRTACELAKSEGARIIVCHVYPPPAEHGEVVARRQDASYYEELWRMLERVRPEEAGIAVEHRLEEGRPADTVVRLATEEGCDLIVMGTHGRAGLRRLLLGSVAEHILRAAPCPVLTVNSPLEQLESVLKADEGPGTGG